VNIELLRIIDLGGTAVFAVTGALVAGRKSMDLFGVIVLGVITGIGGGTLRDLLLGHTPVFWVEQPVYVLVAVVAAVLTVAMVRFWTANQILLLLLDACGLAFFCVLGAVKAKQAGSGHVIVVLMGIMTGTFGGLLRDLLADEIPLILRHDLYAGCALVGAGIFDLLFLAGTPIPVAVWGGIASALVLRLAAIRWHLGLPVFSLGRRNQT